MMPVTVMADVAASLSLQLPELRGAKLRSATEAELLGGRQWAASELASCSPQRREAPACWRHPPRRPSARPRARLAEQAQLSRV